MEELARSILGASTLTPYLLSPFEGSFPILPLPSTRPHPTSTQGILKLQKRTVVVIRVSAERPIILLIQLGSSETFREEKIPHNATIDSDSCTLPATNWAHPSKLEKRRPLVSKKDHMSQSTIVQERKQSLTQTSETIK